MDFNPIVFIIGLVIVIAFYGWKGFIYYMVGFMIIGILFEAIFGDRKKMNKSEKQNMQKLRKQYKRYKRDEYSDFWSYLEDVDKHLYSLACNDYDKRNKKIEEWDKAYPRIIRKRVGGGNKDMRWDGYKEIEVWDD